MPYADRWRTLTSMTVTGLLYRADLGSVFAFGEAKQLELADKCRTILEEVNRISRGVWEWYSAEETIYRQCYASELVGGGQRKPGDNQLVKGPVDQHKFLYINFASKDDAMLVRISVMDLEKVRNADSGGVSREAK